ncbi:MAG: gamma-glutamylcyclotransferase [Meiothermus sp.]|uniref:gamma-glutamylcyclotransferase family protein n=1 Tax=Meiothermus sp. TaxID=1955249 RepID=UPI0025E106FC|nr:gamma-glutamylcyclotransferase family protein [Meiothermus sp.]MCS7058771.1 gamma-glutamylcyclotransferase [Meiothermus sp.]MCS7195390.1 gamma-glutamylcyclotransferase [Meiothermus sp.]MDW8091009.1 gamma-glutamylcyclotransferase family protein [Meiothermus sp.]
MMEPEAVFVYGTLKQGQRNFEVARRAGWLCSEAAYVEGFQLYHLPRGSGRSYGYPAAVYGEGRVWGEVQWFAELARALLLLDRLEDEGQEYRRVAAWAHTEGKGRVWVWLYVYPSLARVQEAQGRWLPQGFWPPHPG